MRNYTEVLGGFLCDVSFYSLQEAAKKIGPSFVYDLFVSSRRELEAAKMLKDMAAHTLENPFAPYVNLHVEDGFDIDEWCIEANGKSFWSKGA